jgi:hypothetical protein
MRSLAKCIRRSVISAFVLVARTPAYLGGVGEFEQSNIVSDLEPIFGSTQR